MYLPNPSVQAGCNTSLFFFQVWIRSFSSLRLVAIIRLKSCLPSYFTHSWRENSWIHTFHLNEIHAVARGISTKGNAYSLVQQLNSCPWSSNENSSTKHFSFLLLLYLIAKSSWYRKPELTGPIGWGCRIHRLRLYRGVRLPQRVS